MNDGADTTYRSAPHHRKTFWRKPLVLVTSSLLALAAVSAYHVVQGRLTPEPSLKRGQIIDRFNGVAVYYNGGVGSVSGRHIAADGYNLGLKYQCVEFVKRYYYERFGHKMPDSYGHARQFFDLSLADGAFNPARDMRQFRNGGGERPKVEDLIVFGPTAVNPYGHVAIVATVEDARIVIVQQNPGPRAPSRKAISFDRSQRNRLDDRYALGWLRLPAPREAAKSQPFVDHRAASM